MSLGYTMSTESRRTRWLASRLLYNSASVTSSVSGWFLLGSPPTLSWGLVAGEVVVRPLWIVTYLGRNLVRSVLTPTDLLFAPLPSSGKMPP